MFSTLQATQNPFYLHVGSHILESLEKHSKAEYVSVYDLEHIHCVYNQTSYASLATVTINWQSKHPACIESLATLQYDYSDQGSAHSDLAHVKGFPLALSLGSTNIWRTCHVLRSWAFLENFRNIVFCCEVPSKYCNSTISMNDHLGSSVAPCFLRSTLHLFKPSLTL